MCPSIASVLAQPDPYPASRRRLGEPGRSKPVGAFLGVNHVTFGDLTTELRELWTSPPTASSASPRREKS